MISVRCEDTEHVLTFGNTCQSINLYFRMKNRISILETWPLCTPHPTLWNLLSDEEDYRLMFSILISLETWNTMSFALCDDCCGNLLCLIFSFSYIILLSKPAKNCLYIWASIFLLFLFLHPQILSVADSLSGILHWRFRSCLILYIVWAIYFLYT